MTLTTTRGGVGRLARRAAAQLERECDGSRMPLPGVASVTLLDRNGEALMVTISIEEVAAPAASKDAKWRLA